MLELLQDILQSEAHPQAVRLQLRDPVSELRYFEDAVLLGYVIHFIRQVLDDQFLHIANEPLLLEGFLAYNLLKILALIKLVNHVTLYTRQRKVHIARIQRNLLMLHRIPKLLILIQDLVERFQSNGIAEHGGDRFYNKFMAHLVQNIVGAYPG